MIAAAVENRVWFEKFKDDKLRPNLYILLVGPSGCGKDTAMRRAMRLMDATNVRTYMGKTTAAHMVDFLTKRVKLPSGEYERRDAKLWLLSPELANSIGSGPMADSFIKNIVDLYGGHDIPWGEGTRTSGLHIVREPCINWLAGSTKEWLAESITKNNMQGGFAARICVIEAPEERPRIFEPQFPPDYETIKCILEDRLIALSQLEAVVERTPAAFDIMQRWYYGRPQSVTKDMEPFWQRQDDLVLKLAMIFRLAEWVEGDDERLQLHTRHVLRAIDWSCALMPALQRLIENSLRTPETTLLVRVAMTIAEAGTITHAKLLRNLYKEGMTAESLYRIVQTLLQAQQIKQLRSYRPGNPIYAWQRRRAHFASNNGGPPGDAAPEEEEESCEPNG